MEFSSNLRLQNRSTKRKSFVRLTRVKMSMVFTRRMWPSSPSTIRAGLFPAHRLALENKIDLTGAHVVVLGRSMIVGKPLPLLLMQKRKGGDATVTVVHS